MRAGWASVEAPRAPRAGPGLAGMPAPKAQNSRFPRCPEGPHGPWPMAHASEVGCLAVQTWTKTLESWVPCVQGRPSPWIYHAACTAAATASAQHYTVLRPGPVLLWDVDRRPPGSRATRSLLCTVAVTCGAAKGNDQPARQPQTPEHGATSWPGTSLLQASFYSLPHLHRQSRSNNHQI